MTLAVGFSDLGLLFDKMNGGSYIAQHIKHSDF